jgi:REP element-mobilizing transposase RayT
MGGVEDHLHLLFQLSRTLTVAQVVEKTKTSTSKWMKERWSVSEFAWQAGYGAFSVSPSDLASTVNYIRNQEAHHAKFSFQDEYRELLRLAGVAWDEQYVWD